MLTGYQTAISTSDDDVSVIDAHFAWGNHIYLCGDDSMADPDVAFSGGPPRADPSWCEKYPDRSECQGGGKL